MQEMNDKPVFFDDRSTSSIETILASIRMMKIKYGIKEAGLRHKEGIRHYQDRKSHCNEDFKAGACWLAEYLMSVPFNEILEELVELKEDIDYDKRTD